jgi:hypothetical protein
MLFSRLQRVISVNLIASSHDRLKEFDIQIFQVTEPEARMVMFIILHQE